MEVNDLEVEEELSTMATQASAEGTWIGKNGLQSRQKRGESKIVEVHTWRQVRGPAGAVMCDSRESGVKWPQRHTLLFEGQGRVDMRLVSPQDVKKMLRTQTRTTHCKKWAAKHEYEELKEGVWFDLIKTHAAKENLVKIGQKSTVMS